MGRRQQKEWYPAGWVSLHANTICSHLRAPPRTCSGSMQPPPLPCRASRSSSACAGLSRLGCPAAAAAAAAAASPPAAWPASAAAAPLGLAAPAAAWLLLAPRASGWGLLGLAAAVRWLQSRRRGDHRRQRWQQAGACLQTAHTASNHGALELAWEACIWHPAAHLSSVASSWRITGGTQSRSRGNCNSCSREEGQVTGNTSRQS